MAENLYEGMFLLDSGQFASDPDGMAELVTRTIEKAGGTVVAHRPWQDGKLAYEIEGRRKGLHYLTYFRMDPASITPFNRSVRLTDKLLRHLVIQQPETLFEAMVASITADEQPDDEEAEASDDDSDSDTDSDDGDDSDDN